MALKDEVHQLKQTRMIELHDIEIGFEDRMKVMVQDEVNRLVEQTKRNIRQGNYIKKLFSNEYHCTTCPVCIISTVAEYPRRCHLHDEAFGGIEVGSEKQRNRLMNYLGECLRMEGYRITLHTDSYRHQFYSCKFSWR